MIIKRTFERSGTVGTEDKSLCRETLERKKNRIHDKQKRDSDDLQAAQIRWRNARDENFQASSQRDRLLEVRRQREETEALINSLGIEIQVSYCSSDSVTGQ